MRILILGGTKFLGLWISRAALARGHTLTLFNRGSNPGLFPGVEELHGDRQVDLGALSNHSWDAVIDTSGYLPGDVARSASLLSSAAGHYTFVSSLSVYASFAQPGMDESAPLAQMQAGMPEDPRSEAYGPLKVLCEAAAEKAFPGRAFIPRPGLIAGPYDPTDRFTYWPVRVAQGGEVLAPGRPDRPVQFIDARDLAEWLVRMVEQARVGVFNANGPARPVSMGQVLETCQAVSGSDARFTWLPEDFLLQSKVAPWSGLPLWIPESDPENAGFFQLDCRKAIAAGLTFRPLAETVRATLEWAAGRPAGQGWKAGISREREEALLAEYHRAGKREKEG